MTQPKHRLRLVPNGERTPGAEIQTMEIRVLKAIRGLSREERTRRSVAIGKRLRPMAVLAADIVAMNQAELGAKVATNSSLFDGFLTDLGEAKADAKALLEVIGVAEHCVAAALANLPEQEFEGTST
jgi:hypothetical protein